MLDDHLIFPPEATPGERRRLDVRFSNLTEGLSDGAKERLFRQANWYLGRFEWPEVRDFLAGFSPVGDDLEAELKQAGQLAHGAGYLRIRQEPIQFPKQRESKLGKSHAIPRDGTHRTARVSDVPPAVTSTDARWIADVWLRGSLPGFVEMVRGSASSVLDGPALTEGEVIGLCVESVRGLMIEQQRRNGGMPLHPLALVSWFQQTASLAQQQQPAGLDLTDGNESKGGPYETS